MTLILNFRNEECHKSHQCFLRLVSQDNIKKIENKQMGPNKAYRLFQSKGNHKQSEQTTYRMGENICKLCNQQGLKFLKYTTSAYNLTTTTKTQPKWKNGQKSQRGISSK